MQTVLKDNKDAGYDKSALVCKASCRFCGTTLSHTFVDLGMSPLCESYIRPDQLAEMEPFYPLHAYVCGQCFLVQLQEFVARGVPVLGIGPAANVAKVAIEKGVSSIVRFFGRQSAAEIAAEHGRP